MDGHMIGNMSSIENNVVTVKPNNDHATQDDKLSSESSSPISNSPLRKIEFHLEEKPFNEFTNIAGAAHSFQLEILSPTNSDDAHNDLIRVQIIDPESGGAELDLENSFCKRIGAGLVNFGNTCFLNSVLQCLTYTQPLVEHLQSGKHHITCQNEGFCALCAIQKHVADALASSGEPLVPWDLFQNLKCINESFQIYMQEDAHEYMVNLLESMHMCCLPLTESNDTSLVHNIFGGRLRSQVKCMECNYCSDKFETFLDLSLEILRVKDIYQALADFTATEELDGGSEIYDCQQCKKKVKALKQITIDQAPNVLMIHLKRFSSFMSGVKIDTKVQFYPTLNLEHLVTGPYDGCLSYGLYGVLVHDGYNTHCGHFYCYVRTSDNIWYLLDDDEVIQVSERAVFQQQAYMLFYCSNKKKPIDVIDDLKETIVHTLRQNNNTRENTEHNNGSIKFFGQTDISDSCIESCPKKKGEDERDPFVLSELTSASNNIVGEKGQVIDDDVMQVEDTSSSTRSSNVATVPFTSADIGPQNQSLSMIDEDERDPSVLSVLGQRQLAFQSTLRLSLVPTWYLNIDAPYSAAHSFQLEILNPTNSDNTHNDLFRVELNDPEIGGAELDPENSSLERIGAGLVNLGNTCFLNSVLQCLTYTQPLVEHLQSENHHITCQNVGFCALCAIQKHVAAALKSSAEPVLPLDLVRNLQCISESFQIFRQEDAHEYMVNLLESMHMCCLPVIESSSANDTSFVHDIFGGRLRSQVICMECNYSSDKFETFLDLSLEIMKVKDIYSALDYFTDTEVLDGGAEVYDCEQCKKKVKALKQITIDQAPNVLTIHLKRFSPYRPGEKIKKKVDFDPTLHLEYFVTGQNDGDLSYSLYGVLVHAGQNTHSGHYYCYVRTSADLWYLLDDDEVILVSEREVLAQRAYMLFYCSNRNKPIDVIDDPKETMLHTMGQNNNTCDNTEHTNGSIQVSAAQMDIFDSCIESWPVSKEKGQDEWDLSELSELTSESNNTDGEKGQDVDDDDDVMQVDSSTRSSIVATVPSTSSNGPQNQSLEMIDEKKTLSLMENEEEKGMCEDVKEQTFVMTCRKLKMAIDEPVCVATVVPCTHDSPPQKQSLVNDQNEALLNLLIVIIKGKEKITCEDVKEQPFVMTCPKLKMAIDEPACVATIVRCTRVSPQKQLSLINDLKDALSTLLKIEHEEKITNEDVSDSNTAMICSKPQMATKEQPVCFETEVIDRCGALCDDGGDDSQKVAVTCTESLSSPKPDTFLINQNVSDRKRHKNHLKVKSGFSKFCSNVHLGVLLNQQRKKKKKRDRNLHKHMLIKTGSDIIRDTTNDTLVNIVENEFNRVTEGISSVVTEASTSLQCKDNQSICSLLTSEDRAAPCWDESESTLHMKEPQDFLGIGYIGDEWDNEYDCGKQKKVKGDSGTKFEGRNGVQDIANEELKPNAGKRKRRRNKRSKRSNSKQRRFRRRH